ncbi:MAG: hypothetical protein V4685_09290 [Bacteroidota bacterium]
MASKQNSPFFTELGNILNLIRNISTELNAEMKIDDSKNGRLFDIIHTRDASIEKLQNRLQELEAEIEYFFTENGLRKTIEDRFNTQALKRKFSNTFKALSNEYFMLKPDDAGTGKENFSGNEEPIF